MKKIISFILIMMISISSIGFVCATEKESKSDIAKAEIKGFSWEEYNLPVQINDFNFTQYGNGFGVGDQSHAIAINYINEKPDIEDQSILAGTLFSDYVATDMKTVSMIGYDSYVFGDYYEYGVIKRLFYNGKPSGYSFKIPEPDSVKNKANRFVHSSTFSTSKNTGIVVAVGKKGVIAKLSVEGKKIAYTRCLDDKEKSITQEDLNKIQILNSNIFWVVGNKGTLLTSKDGGKTWLKIKLDSKLNLSNVYFIDEDNGFVTADSGGIYYTYDSGFHWYNIYEKGSGKYNKILMNSNNELWVLKDSNMFLVSKMFANSIGTNGYKDVYDTNPALKEIRVLTENGVFEGYKGYFYPSKGYTRAEAVTILSRLSNLNPSVDVAFNDVGIDDWYYSYVQSMSSYNIINGYGDGSFRPNKIVTLEELCKIIKNLDDKLGKHTQVVESDGPIENYKYKTDISGWALESMNYCLEKGYLDNMDLENLTPKSSLKRREVAVIIYNYLKQ